MSHDVVVPALGESVTEAIVARWYKQVGESVNQDEPIVELETDKVTLEVNASAAGNLAEIVASEGDTVEVGALLAKIGEGAGSVASNDDAKQDKKSEAKKSESKSDEAVASPAAQKLMKENNINSVDGTGKDGRINKEDVLKAMEGGSSAAPAAPAISGPARDASDREEKVRMTGLRRRIAQRLKESQNTAAILTTFNEIDMSYVMDFRNQYKDDFAKKYGIKLGFMSFFVKAAVAALKEIPEVNAEISGDSIIYKNHYDIGVAVGTENGLVVPVIRDADQKSYADIELEIAALAKKARDGQLSMEDMMGGTFTISNGGVYGSLMSTPIINPPQSGILGMHKTQDRPVVVDGQIVVRPMMYVALSYDHRLVDGRESVTFLKRVKEGIEDPRRLLLDL